MDLSELSLYEDLLLVNSSGYTRIGRLTKKSVEHQYFQLASYENRKESVVWKFSDVTKALPVSRLLDK